MWSSAFLFLQTKQVLFSIIPVILNVPPQVNFKKEACLPGQFALPLACALSYIILVY